MSFRRISRLPSITHAGQSFAADLFSVLHCQTVLIIKTEDPSLVPPSMDLLEKGVGLLRWTSEMRPSPKNRGLLEAANRLLSNAKQSRASVATDQFSPLWRDFLNFTSAPASSSVPEQPNVWPTGEQILPAGWPTELPSALGANTGTGAQGGETFDAFFASLFTSDEVLPRGQND